ncbi:MAG: SDR family oxidoreductase, partial [Micromonosporaceae bacterium]
AQEMVALGVRATPLPWDLSEPSALDGKVATVTAEVGDVDILVNVTGGPPPTPAAGQPVQVWQAQFSSMVLSVIAVTDAFLPGMRRRGWGRVITVASSGVVAPIPNLGISNTLRASLVGWSKTLAGEVGPDGVTCNVVAPGRIATGRVRSLDAAKAERNGQTAEEVRGSSEAGIPLRRYGDPAEFGDVVAFLSSERAGYVTGSTVRVDGGYIPSI